MIHQERKTLLKDAPEFSAPKVEESPRNSISYRNQFGVLDSSGIQSQNNSYFNPTPVREHTHGYQARQDSGAYKVQTNTSMGQSPIYTRGQTDAAVNFARDEYLNYVSMHDDIQAKIDHSKYQASLVDEDIRQQQLKLQQAQRESENLRRKQDSHSEVKFQTIRPAHYEAHAQLDDLMMQTPSQSSMVRDAAADDREQARLAAEWRASEHKRNSIAEYQARPDFMLKSQPPQ